MIDPGHPFSLPYETLIESLEDSIRNGVEQPDRVRFVFQSAVTTYELPRIAYAITRVSGQMNSNFTIFEAGKHYQLSNNRLIWIDATERPDEGSRVEVEYTYRDARAGLTDLNPGSVTGTLLRAVAREIKLLYEQMDEAYRRAFIEVAAGVALDNVVALLGVVRKPAIKATGQVTFFRKTATKTAVTIDASTRVADESGRTFVTLKAGTIPTETDEFLEQFSGILHVSNQIAELIGIWPQAADPVPANSFPSKATASGQRFGENERTITLADGVRPQGRLLIRYKPKSVTVPIEAVEAGPKGNVNAGAVTIMPTPPKGVDGAINETPVSGGQNAEPDEQLRERATHALEQAGNATLNAIKFAVLGVDGVEGVEVRDRTTDDTIPLGEVRVRYSGGDSETRQQAIEQEVKRVVDQTRAAGILARVESIRKILISGRFYVIPDLPVSDATLETVRSGMKQFRSKAIEAIQSLSIGNPLSVRRLNALIYGIPGLADVAEAQLNHNKPGQDPAVTDPFLIGNTELLRPDAANLAIVRLTGLRATSRTNEIDLELLDGEELSGPDENSLAFRSSNQPVEFTALSIAINGTVKAKLKNEPNKPPERIGGFTRSVEFNHASTQTLRIERGDIQLSDTRLGEYMLNAANEGEEAAKVTLSAAAYPGLSSIDIDVNLVF